MKINALIAYTHYLSFLLMFLFIVVEASLIQRKIRPKKAKTIARADMGYGIMAILVVTTGFIRMSFEKGMEYYFSNTLFLIKLGLFTAVGLLSIYPTVIFFKWRKTIKAGSPVVLKEETYHHIRNIIYIELFLVLLIPLFAAMMARGVGM